MATGEAPVETAGRRLTREAEAEETLAPTDAYVDPLRQQLRANSDLFDAESDYSGAEAEEEEMQEAPVAGPETGDGQKPMQPKPNKKKKKKVREKTEKQRQREEDELRQQTARLIRDDNSLTYVAYHASVFTSSYHAVLGGWKG